MCVSGQAFDFLDYIGPVDAIIDLFAASDAAEELGLTIAPEDEILAVKICAHGGVA